MGRRVLHSSAAFCSAHKHRRARIETLRSVNMGNSEGYVTHPCQGCEAEISGCELHCRLLERWNLKHIGDVDASRFLS